MKITVTQQHIDKGRMREAFSCPIALAIMESSGIPTVAVNASGITVYNSTCDLGTKFGVPEAARNFMVDFDRALPVSPFTFNLVLA